MVIANNIQIYLFSVLFTICAITGSPNEKKKQSSPKRPTTSVSAKKKCQKNFLCLLCCRLYLTTK